MFMNVRIKILVTAIRIISHQNGLLLTNILHTKQEWELIERNFHYD